MALSTRSLPQLLDETATRSPDRVAVEELSDSTVTYRELAALADRVGNRLRHLGVQRGDRVGLCVRKSVDAVAAVFGTMKAGAAYVPVDPEAPAWRSAYVFNDCAVKAAIVETQVAEPLIAEMSKLGPLPTLVLLDGVGGGKPLEKAIADQDATPTGSPVAAGSDDLAYILYTSGSTGRPKGVMLTHGNALSFVDWCSETFRPTPADRFSSHAPLHFDLSILDLYVSLRHGATLVLIGPEAGREPVGLARLIAERRLTVWYSAPSILSMLVQYGKLERHDYSALRLVLFAGEVFPVRYLRSLQQKVAGPRYFNLYGPTETNVCTYYEIRDVIPIERTEPYPIGRVCENLAARVVDRQGNDVRDGDEGELVISGPNVMQGYWNLPDRTAGAFYQDSAGRQWYRTGDIVYLDGDGDYVFVGRRDRMVKRRGHRVELGEIEAVLYRYPAVSEAAVIAMRNEESGVRIKAFLTWKGERPPSAIELKRFCAENMAKAMIPDEFVMRDELPKTSTDKIDYQRLQELA